MNTSKHCALIDEHWPRFELDLAAKEMLRLILQFLPPSGRTLTDKRHPEAEVVGVDVDLGGLSSADDLPAWLSGPAKALAAHVSGWDTIIELPLPNAALKSSRVTSRVDNLSVRAVQEWNVLGRTLVSFHVSGVGGVADAFRVASFGRDTP